LFYSSRFNGDISEWNTANVESMIALFKNSKFNGDISSWDVAKVKTMRSTFSESIFKGDISNWNVSSLQDMTKMFDNCPTSIPYWAKIKDLEQRNKAITSYQLAKYLNNELSENNNSSKKMKI
jgi:hypothetical protein